jgi:hypothetical protein
MLQPASLVFCLLDGIGLTRAQNLEVFILANFIRPATFQKYILHSLVGQVSRQHNSSLLVPNILILPVRALHNTVVPTALAYGHRNHSQRNKVVVDLVKVILEVAWVGTPPPGLISWCIAVDQRIPIGKDDA